MPDTKPVSAQPNLRQITMDKATPTSALKEARTDRGPRLIANSGRFRAILFAVLMHIVLAAFLMIGVRWNTQKPVAVQAELWTPPPPLVRPAPKPEPKVEPKPEPAPVVEPKPIEPPPTAKPEPLVKPDIALEREEKERKEREAAEAQAKRELDDKKKRDEELKKAEEKKAEIARARAEELERKKAEEEKKREEQKKEAEEKKLAEKKAADAKKLAEAKAKKEAADDEKSREDYLKRLVDSAGKPSDSAKPSSNQAGQTVGASSGGASGGADGGYAARIASALRSNTAYQVPADLPGNPKAVFLLILAPDCSIVSVKLRKSSGTPNWDDAAERGISRTDPFPKPREGPCQREIEITRGPRDAKP